MYTHSHYCRLGVFRTATRNVEGETMLWKGSKHFSNPLGINFQVNKASDYWSYLDAIKEGEMVNDVVIFPLKSGGHVHRFGHRPFCMREVLINHPGLLPIDQRGTAFLKNRER